LEDRNKMQLTQGYLVILGVKSLYDKDSPETAMPRDYKKEYENYQGTPEQLKNRAQRNKARAMMTKAGRVTKGDGKDVDHAQPLSKGGTSTAKNLRVKTASSNRSFSRNPNGSIKVNKK
jgi:hypothetical protein